MNSKRTSASTTKYGRYALAGGVLAVCMGLLAAAAPPSPRLSRDLQALLLIAGGEGEVDVIISYAGSEPGTLRRARVQEVGGIHRRDLSLIHGMAARVPVAALGELARDPDVLSIALDDEITAASDVAVPASGATLARQVHGVDGAGIRVAVLDSGVAPVSALGGRLVAWVDLVQPQAPAPTDPFGHGTHVAGLIAGSMVEMLDPGERRSFGGVAPGAEIVSVRVLDHLGRGRVSDAIAGLDWVLTRATELNIRIVNLSLGHPVRDPAAHDPLVQACERAWNAGLLVVVSAGNLGREAEPFGTVTSPGNSALVLTVGALSLQGTLARSDDVVASYSSRGPSRFDTVVKPDLLAPGDQLVSLRSPLSLLDRRFPENRLGARSRGAGDAELFRLSGTSMAAAMVSGSAALLLSGDPGLTPTALKARLMRSAEKHDDNLFTQGAGRLDVMAAMDLDVWVGSGGSARAARDDLTVHVLPGPEGKGDPAGNLEALYGPASQWGVSTLWDRDVLWSGDSGEQVVWQVPQPAQPGAQRAWQWIRDAAARNVVWQLVDSPLPRRHALHRQSVVWQPRPGEAPPPLQPTDDFLSNESVVWQGRPVTLSDPDQDLLGTQSVVRQRTDSMLRILSRGDGAEAP
jgi:serine protease AprX